MHHAPPSTRSPSIKSCPAPPAPSSKDSPPVPRCPKNVSTKRGRRSTQSRTKNGLVDGCAPPSCPAPPAPCLCPLHPLALIASLRWTSKIFKIPSLNQDYTNNNLMSKSPNKDYTNNNLLSTTTHKTSPRVTSTKYNHKIRNSIDLQLPSLGILVTKCKNKIKKKL